MIPSNKMKIDASLPSKDSDLSMSDESETSRGLQKNGSHPLLSPETSDLSEENGESYSCLSEFEETSGGLHKNGSHPLLSPETSDLSEENGESYSCFSEFEGENDTPTSPMGLVTAEMHEEEKKLEAANVMAEETLRLQKQVQEEKELKEQRYKRLMHLLNKSTFYSQFLLKQIESQEAMKKRKISSRMQSHEVSADEENVQSSGDSTQESFDGTTRKRKRNGDSASYQGKHVRNKKYRIADVIDTNTVKAKVEERSYNEENKRSIELEQPRLFENGVMRSYQLDGFSWLTVLYENGVNGILGDEMGLGKTIQCIALICHLVEQGVQGPFLVCGPLSTLPNWMSEFERFAPKIPTLLYHGGDGVRIDKRKRIKIRVPVEGAPSPVFPVVITSYEVAVRDTRFLNKFNWRYICVDEGHRLKNYKCRLTKSLNTYSSSNRLLLTGTPLQNSLAELWALLNFLMPEIFDSLDVFESWFDVTELMEKGSDEKIIQQEKENQVISTLMKILSPFFLRRVKKDVDIDIPPKKELLVYTPMTPLQVKLYEATLTMNYEIFNAMKNSEPAPIEYNEMGRPKRKSKQGIDYSAFMEDGKEERSLDRFIEAIRIFHKKPTEKEVEKTSVTRIKMQNRMMQCRKIVNHPYLIDYPIDKDGTFKVDNGLLEVCGKLQVLDQLLGELHKRGHRVLLFSQMTMMLDILEDYLTLRPSYKYKRLDGKRALADRQNDIKEFNDKESTDFLYLLSTRAGGLGINLTSADTVIIYDSDWNPQSDLQAQDRCHRIGQTIPVLVLRLITASTIDERIVERAAAKRKLEKLIIQSGKFKATKERDRVFEKVMEEEELISLLNQRDHDRIHRTTTGHVFTKEELNQLLDRSDLTWKGNQGKEVGKQVLRGVFRVMNEGDI